MTQLTLLHIPMHNFELKYLDNILEKIMKI